MAKRKKKKSTPLFWKAVKGGVHLLTLGFLKSMPLLVFAGIGFGIFWGIRQNLYADSGFLIQTVKIIPEGSLSRDKVRELEKLFLNQNLFQVSPKRVADVVETDPKIRNAHVVREFPKTLRIEIRDRNPFAQVLFSETGEYYTLAEDRIVLARDPGRNKNLLLIEIFDEGNKKLKLGEGVDLAGFHQTMELAKVYPKQALAQSEVIDRLCLDHLGNVSLLLQGGPELRFGREPMKKLQSLASLGALLKSPDRAKIIYIELQYHDLIVKKKEK